MSAYNLHCFIRLYLFAFIYLFLMMNYKRMSSASNAHLKQAVFVVSVKSCGKVIHTQQFSRSQLVFRQEQYAFVGTLSFFSFL